MIPATDRGFLLGDGVFETLRAEGGRPLLLERHLARLKRSAAIIGLDFDPATAERRVADALDNISTGPASVRLTLSRGSGPRGLLPPRLASPLTIAQAAKAGPRSINPVKAAFSSIRRNAGSPTGSLKTLGYLDNILARMEVEPDAEEAIMLNTDGYPACTSIGNILVKTKEGWVTPPASLGGILPGIVREVLLEKGAISEAEVTQHDLQTLPLARTNSLIGVQPMVLDYGAPAEEAEVASLTAVLEEAESQER